MRNDRHDEPLTDAELELFVQYLHRFARHDVDLFALVEAGDPEYPCYVAMSRTPLPGTDPAAYRRP
ncbi:hypothetical protein [Streptomyces sp. VNUA24]|uniref:hypothetical protein n=1 Tax=Streptomyces sp. VNUA24 TaxID=3031131 RepID=UPI0023B87684|nr:hypothetical protein [Streptomyces sp. VNUA24]WEH16560.1 hypothetical protein PYR72_23745 [Streptomyces sp. VNUA24]